MYSLADSLSRFGALLDLDPLLDVCAWLHCTAMSPELLSAVICTA